MVHIHIAPYDHNKFLIPKARPTSIKVCDNVFSWKSPPFPMGERLSLTVCVKKYCPVCWYSDSSLFLPSVSLCCLRNPKDRKIQLLKTPCTRHRKRKIRVILTWRILPCWLAFMMPEGLKGWKSKWYSGTINLWGPVRETDFFRGMLSGEWPCTHMTQWYGGKRTWS